VIYFSLFIREYPVRGYKFSIIHYSLSIGLRNHRRKQPGVRFPQRTGGRPGDAGPFRGAARAFSGHKPVQKTEPAVKIRIPGGDIVFTHGLTPLYAIFCGPFE
jgi:hypothetical protein